jgi:two-component system chemotaxis response regulator CheB
VGTKESIEATCPDCRGPLSVIRNDSLVEFRCLVGHTYSANGLLAAHSDTQEKALWSAVVSLRESANIVEAVADQIAPERLAKLRLQVKKKLAEAAALEDILENLEAFEL